jgi:hypothetical protein
MDQEPKTRRPWRRRAVWAAAAVALYAIVGFFLVPLVARGQLEKILSETLHRQATVARVRFNPFTLTARIEGFDLKDRDGAPLLRFDRLTVNLQVSGLFRRAWRFRDILLEEPRGAVRILADGTLSIADLLAPAPPDPAAEKAADAPPSRIVVDRFTLSGGAVDFIDRSREPLFTETFAPINLSVEDLTTIPDETGDHTLNLGIGKQARLTWSGRQTVDPLRLEGRVEITNISLPNLGNYALAGHRLEIREGTLDIAAAYDIARSADATLSVALEEGSVTAHDLAVRPHGEAEDWLVVPRAEVRGARIAWPESRVEIEAVRLASPRAVAWLQDGQVNWQQALAAPEPAHASPTAASREPAPTAVTREPAPDGRKARGRHLPRARSQALDRPDRRRGDRRGLRARGGPQRRARRRREPERPRGPPREPLDRSRSPRAGPRLRPHQ